MDRESVNTILAGTCGGFGQVFAGHPFDTLKVRAQNSPAGTSLKEIVQSIYSTKGFRGFYAGAGSSLSGVGGLNAVCFFAKHQATKITPSITDSSYGRSYLNGMFGGFCASWVECPTDFFKTQAQVQKSNESVFSIAASLVKKHGIAVAYQGNSGTLARNVPAYGFYFLAFDVWRSIFGTDGLNTFIAGGLGGFAFWALTYPTDTIKGVLQAQDPANKRYRGFFHCASELYKEGGVVRFTRGFGPCIARSVPANAVCFSVFELTMTMLHAVQH